jgi:hypothetical protein
MEDLAGQGRRRRTYCTVEFPAALVPPAATDTDRSAGVPTWWYDGDVGGSACTVARSPRLASLALANQYCTLGAGA